MASDLDPSGTVGPVGLARLIDSSTWRSTQVAAYGLGFVLCCVWAWQLGHDSNWDLFSYHLYNGTAVFNGAFNDDVAAAGIQTFLNLLIDIPLGAAVTVFGPRLGIVVATATLQFLSYLAVWRLTRTLATGADSVRSRVVLAGFAFAGSGAIVSMAAVNHTGFVTMTGLSKTTFISVRDAQRFPDGANNQ